MKKRTAICVLLAGIILIGSILFLFRTRQLWKENEIIDIIVEDMRGEVPVSLELEGVAYEEIKLLMESLPVRRSVGLMGGYSMEKVDFSVNIVESNKSWHLVLGELNFAYHTDSSAKYDIVQNEVYEQLVTKLIAAVEE